MGSDVAGGTVCLDPNPGRRSGRRSSAVERRPRPFPISSCPLASGLLEVLPDGFTIELCPAAEEWWREAAMALECGKLLTIDYGLTAEEFFVPERKEGTLRGYHRHRSSSDVLACPGRAGHHGTCEFHCHSGRRGISRLEDGRLPDSGAIPDRALPRAPGKMKARLGNGLAERTRQFQTLTHPEHLGRSFRVLVQSRRVSWNLRGIHGSRAAAATATRN